MITNITPCWLPPPQCWILTQPRTGSSYLCDLLNRCGVFSSYDRGEAFNEWLAHMPSYNSLCENPPNCCKAMYHHYIEVVNSVPLSERWDQNRSMTMNLNHQLVKNTRLKWKLNCIQSILPGVKFLRLLRNPVDQAVSTYFARKSGKWHLVSSDQQNSYLSEKYDVDIKVLIDVYNEVRQYGDCWLPLYNNQTNTMDVQYEDLIKDPVCVIGSILEFLDLTHVDPVTIVNTQRANPKFLPMTRSETLHVRKNLQSILCKVML